MRYKIGTKDTCPLTNIHVRGVTFPRFTGPPGGNQTAGALAELSDTEASNLRAAIDAREVRRYKGGSASVCLKTDSEEGRPEVVKRWPLSACVYLLNEANDQGEGPSE